MSATVHQLPEPVPEGWRMEGYFVFRDVGADRLTVFISPFGEWVAVLAAAPISRVVRAVDTLRCDSRTLACAAAELEYCGCRVRRE